MGLVGFNGILLVGFNYEWLWTIKFMEIPHVQLVKSRTENWVGHNSLVSIIDKLKYPKTLWIVIVFIKYIQFDSISPYLGVQITLFTPTAMTKKNASRLWSFTPQSSKRASCSRLCQSSLLLIDCRFTALRLSTVSMVPMVPLRPALVAGPARRDSSAWLRPRSEVFSAWLMCFPLGV